MEVSREFSWNWILRNFTVNKVLIEPYFNRSQMEICILRFLCPAFLRMHIWDFCWNLGGNSTIFLRFYLTRVLFWKVNHINLMVTWEDPLAPLLTTRSCGPELYQCLPRIELRRCRTLISNPSIHNSSCLIIKPASNDFAYFFQLFPKFNVIRWATSSLNNYPMDNICQICVIWKHIHEKCESVITESWPTFSNGSAKYCRSSPPSLHQPLNDPII